MIKKCLICNKIFNKRTNKKYCSPKCREHARYLRRKDNFNYKHRKKINSRKYELKLKEKNKIKRENFISQKIREMQTLSAAMGGKCIDNRYINAFHKLKWKCKNGHIWFARLSCIKDGCWCPYCANVKKKTINDMHKLAAKKEGTCLSEKYTNMITKLNWRCKNGHSWDALPSSISSGSWCPICSQGISERICRGFFEKIFKVKFNIGKYKWLLSPKKAPMQLDGYNKKLKLAFEYQGIQHYKLNGIRYTKQNLNYQKQCDQIKRDQCKEKRITLIEVPYTIKYNDMEKYILNEYYKNTNIKIPYKNIDYLQFDTYSIDKIKEMQEIAASKGGKCLSKIYINNYTPLKWICKNKHIWNTTAHHIRRGTWCPICYKSKRFKYWRN